MTYSKKIRITIDLGIRICRGGSAKFAPQIYALAINLPHKTKHIYTKHAASHFFHPTFPKITSSFPTSFNKYIVTYKYSRIHYCKILDHNNYIGGQTLIWKKKRKRWSNKEKKLKYERYLHYTRYRQWVMADTVVYGHGSQKQ